MTDSLKSVLSPAFFSKRRLPVFLSDEKSECGLLCAAMVAQYWGQRVDLPVLRINHNISRGVTLEGLINILSSLGLVGRALKVPLESLASTNVPAILHWDLNHFVVLKSLHRDVATIHDPSRGEVKMTADEVSDHYTGILVEVGPGSVKTITPAPERVPINFLVGHVNGVGFPLLSVFALGLLLQILALLSPAYVQWLIDEAIQGDDRSLVFVLGGAFVMLALLQGLTTGVRNWAIAVFSTSIGFQWATNLFSHLVKLPLVFFARRHLADIVSRFASMDQIQRTISTQAVEIIVDGALVSTTFLIICFYSLGLAAISAIIILIYLLLRISLYGRLQRRIAEQVIREAAQKNHLFETIRGMQPLRIYAKEVQRRSTWMNLLALQLDAVLGAARITALQAGITSSLFTIERVLTAGAAAMLAIDGTMSTGMFVAYMAYREHFASHSASLIDKALDILALRAHGRRLADITTATPENNLGSLEATSVDLVPSIEFRNVSFRYSDEGPLILENCSFKIAAGEAVAFAGPSGVGKTTAVKILLGLLRPQDGEIFIGGLSLRKAGLAKSRSMIGTVMQDDVLFTGTIFENISFFDDSASETRVRRAATMAAIAEDIEFLPMGYYTIVGSEGGGLSGGQVQRILLARAFYREPQILVLDEATSELDINTESAIAHHVRESHATRIYVAHRPETLRMADRIIYFPTAKTAHNQQPI